MYYYFYQLFKNKAEVVAASRKRNGHGDGTPGMFSWLLVAAAAGYVSLYFTFFFEDPNLFAHCLMYHCHMPKTVVSRLVLMS